MYDRYTTSNRLYYILPGAGFVISVINLFSGAKFWPAYRFFMIAWYVGLLIAYFAAASLRRKPGTPFVRGRGPFYYIGGGMDKELVWAYFCVEALIFCCLTVFTDGFLSALVHLLILFPTIPLIFVLIYMLWIPSVGDVWTIGDLFYGLIGYHFDQGGGGGGGSGGSTYHTCYDGTKVPLDHSYLDHYPGTSFQEKHDNYMKRP